MRHAHRALRTAAALIAGAAGGIVVTLRYAEARDRREASLRERSEFVAALARLGHPLEWAARPKVIWRPADPTRWGSWRPAGPPESRDLDLIDPGPGDENEDTSPHRGFRH